MAVSSAALGVTSLVLLAGAAVIDLQRVEANTLVIYTTPALQPYLEQVAIPTFTGRTGIPVVIVTLNAAQEYNRLRMSPNRPEADLFIHASPMYLEKGYQEGLFEPFVVDGTPPEDGNQSRAVDGGRIWVAFAWSPLVEVYSASAPSPPDITRGSERLGLGHPLLSNNGVYVVLLLEAVHPEGAQGVVARTVVQPTNARATVQGVADRSFDATMGYEAVVLAFQGQGAEVAYDVPLIDGRRVTTPALFCVAKVKGHIHEGADTFVNMLFTRALQGRLPEFSMRPVLAGVEGPQGIDLSGATFVHYDWSRWAELESQLGDYEVKA